MNIQHVNIVARYEAKLLRRNIVFLGFVILAMIGISLWQVVNQGGDNVFWYKVAFASSLPFFNVYYYNLVQVLRSCIGREKERRWKFSCAVRFGIASIVSGDFGGFSKCSYL